MDKRVGRKAVRKRVSCQSKTPKDCTLQQAFEMFFLAKSAEGLRKRTLSDYNAHYRYFSQWLLTTHPKVGDVREISSQILREYIYYLSHEKPHYEGHPYKSEDDKSHYGLSPASVNVRITTMKCFFRWLYTEGVITTNPTVNVKKQTVEEDHIGAFTSEQIDLLLAQPIKRTFAGFRDYVLMRLLLESGMRISEVLSLTEDNVDLKGRYITLKGGKARIVKHGLYPYQQTCADF